MARILNALQMKKLLLISSLATVAAAMAAGKGSSDPVVMTVGGQDVPLSEFEYLYNKNNAQQVEPVSFEQYVDMFVNYKLKVADACALGLDTTASFRAEFEKYCAELDSAAPDFEHLVKEYRDGILLFDVSNQKVWERASKDQAGLEEYFRANQANYTWDKPHYKGFIIMAPTDSILEQVVAKAEEVYPTVSSGEEFSMKMRRQFGPMMRMVRVLAPQGDNPVIDHVAFGAELPVPEGQSAPAIASFRGQVIDAPQEANDVRSMVVNDYQAALEQEWIQYLHDTYPVKIYEKNLKKAKRKE